MIKHVRWARHLLMAGMIAATSLGHASPQAAADKITVNMRDADIRTVSQWMSEQTGKQFILHNGVKGNISVVSNEPVSRDEAYRLFLAALQVNGIAAVETPDGIKLLPEGASRFAGVPLVQNGDSLAASGAQMASRVITVQHAKAEQVATLLRPLVGPQGVVTANAQTNAVLVTDYGDNLRRIESIVARIDQGGSLNIEAIPLQYGNATDVSKSLQGMIGHDSTASAESGGGVSMAFGAEERTNSVLISGTPAQRAQLRGLVNRLDRPVTGEGNTQVVYLKYANAKEVAEILKGIAESIQKDQKVAEPGGVRIQPSESTNAVVINAPPAMQSSFKSVISQLDVRRAQVLVEALVVEVNDQVAKDLGVSWATNNDYATDPKGGPVTLVNTLGRLKLTDDITKGSTTAGSLLPGMTFGFYKDGELRAALRALSSNTKTNVLSTPTIVALDNEEANLLVGQNVPFKTGQATTAASGTDNPFTTIERKDIGVGLKITPHINQGDSITLEIEQTTESIAPSTSQASDTDLITNKTEIKTRALIKDGDVLVIGGLIRDDQQETQSKVPLLGDIPVLGSLFRSTGADNNKANLMVFIHPVILRDDAIANRATSRRYEHMRGAQQEQGVERAMAPTPQTPTLPQLDAVRKTP